METSQKSDSTQRRRSAANKRRKKTPEQLQLLREAYASHSKWTRKEDIEALAKQCMLSSDEVYHWFRNMRQKDKKSPSSAVSSSQLASVDPYPFPDAALVAKHLTVKDIAYICAQRDVSYLQSLLPKRCPDMKSDQELLHLAERTTVKEKLHEVFKGRESPKAVSAQSQDKGMTSLGGMTSQAKPNLSSSGAMLPGNIASSSQGAISSQTSSWGEGCWPQSLQFGIAELLKINSNYAQLLTEEMSRRYPNIEYAVAKPVHSATATVASPTDISTPLGSVTSMPLPTTTNVPSLTGDLSISDMYPFGSWPHSNPTYSSAGQQLPQLQGMPDGDLFSLSLSDLLGSSSNDLASMEMSSGTAIAAMMDSAIHVPPVNPVMSLPAMSGYNPLRPSDIPPFSAEQEAAASPFFYPPK